MLSLDIFGFLFCIWAIEIIPTVLECMRGGDSNCQSGFRNQLTNTPGYVLFSISAVSPFTCSLVSRACSLFMPCLKRLVLPFYLICFSPSEEEHAVAIQCHSLLLLSVLVTKCVCDCNAVLSWQPKRMLQGLRVHHFSARPVMTPGV